MDQRPEDLGCEADRPCVYCVDDGRPFCPCCSGSEPNLPAPAGWEEYEDAAE